MKYIFVIIALFITASYAQSQQAFSINEAIEFGLQHSNSMKLKNLEIAQAEQNVKEYHAIGFPKLNGSVQYQHYIDIPTSFIPAEVFGGPKGEFAELQFGLSNTFNAGLSLNQLLFDGSFFTGLKAQNVYRELTRKSINQTEYEIRKNVTEAYVNILLGIENIKILDKNLENLDKSIVETKAYLENGFIEKLDLDRLELSYDNLLSQKKQIASVVELGKNILKFQMNYPLDKELSLSQTLDDIVDQVLMDDANINKKSNYNLRPEYESILLSQELNKINLKATKNTRYPNLIGFANYQTQLQRNDLFDDKEPGFTPISIVGVQMNVPIYNGGSVKIKEERIRLDIQKSDIQKQEFERGIDLQISNAYHQYQIAKESMFSAKRRQVLAEDIQAITKIKYKEGVGSSLETSQAEREVYAAQQQYMQALFDLVSSKVALDIATGEINNNTY